MGNIGFVWLFVIAAVMGAIGGAFIGYVVPLP